MGKARPGSGGELNEELQGRVTATWNGCIVNESIAILWGVLSFSLSVSMTLTFFCFFFPPGAYDRAVCRSEGRWKLNDMDSGFSYTLSGLCGSPVQQL